MKKLFSTTAAGITADQAFAIAQAIGQCDFRTTISRYATGDDAPWIVSVGHGRNIGRFVIVESHKNADEAELRQLPTDYEGKDIVNVRVFGDGEKIMLSELLQIGFIGIVNMLKKSPRIAA